jgi:hypothetical protein
MTPKKSQRSKKMRKGQHDSFVEFYKLTLRTRIERSEKIEKNDFLVALFGMASQKWALERDSSYIRPCTVELLEEQIWEGLRMQRVH